MSITCIYAVDTGISRITCGCFSFQSSKIERKKVIYKYRVAVICCIKAFANVR